MANESVRVAMQQFVKEIYSCRSPEKARELQHRISDYYASHTVENEDDMIMKSGVGEMLYMLAQA